MDSDRTPAATSFSLRHLVREVLDTTTMNDPHAIAPEVLRRIDASDLRTALGECLPAMVREMIRSSRNGGFLSTPPPQASPPRLTLHTGPDVAEVMSEHPGGGPLASVGRAPARKSGRSAKVAAIRAAGPKWLNDRLNTGAERGDYKRIGDCTFMDLMFAVRQRREQVARTSAAADRYERLAELVRTHGVERVRDLPASVLAEVGGAAA